MPDDVKLNKKPIIGRIVREGINPDNAVLGNVKFRVETSVAIASGALVVPSGQTVIVVQAETGTADTLTDITTKVGLVLLHADAGDTITITDNGSDAANKIRTRTGADVVLSETAYAAFYRKATTDTWRSLDILERIIDVDELTVGSAIDLSGIIAGTRIPFGGTLNTNANLNFTSNVLNTPNATIGSQLELTATSVQLKSSGGVQGFLRLHENDANGASYVEIIAPASLSGNFQWVLPSDTPTAGEVLKVTSIAAGVVTLEFGSPTEFFGIAMSDETTVLGAASTSVPLATMHAPYAFTITEVQAGLRTAGTGAALITVDIHVAGTTIMSSTKITIDASEKTSVTAATQPVLTTTAVAKGDLIEFFLDQRDTDNVATGLKCYIVGSRT